MNKTHPSRWKVRVDPNNNRMLHLPLGPKEYIKIGAKSYGAIWRMWLGKASGAMRAKTYLAGDFAEVLNELKRLDINLRNVKFVSKDAAYEIPLWMERYELLVSKHNQAINAEQRHPKPVKPDVKVEEIKVDEEPIVTPKQCRAIATVLAKSDANDALDLLYKARKLINEEGDLSELDGVERIIVRLERWAKY